MIKQLEIGPMKNLCYIVEDSCEAVVIDPGWEKQKIIKAIGKNKLKYIINTHSHYDHAQESEELSKKTGAVILYFGKVKDGDFISVGRIKLLVIHTPGHSKDSVCFLMEGIIFTGDTLFIGSAGRTDLESGDSKELFESLKKIKKLDDNVIVYPGHSYSGEKTTIGKEKKTNKYLLCKTKKEFMVLHS